MYVFLAFVFLVYTFMHVFFHRSYVFHHIRSIMIRVTHFVLIWFTLNCVLVVDDLLYVFSYEFCHSFYVYKMNT